MRQCDVCKQIWCPRCASDGKGRYPKLYVANVVRTVVLVINVKIFDEFDQKKQRKKICFILYGDR